LRACEKTKIKKYCKHKNISAADVSVESTHLHTHIFIHIYFGKIPTPSWEASESVHFCPKIEAFLSDADTPQRRWISELQLTLKDRSPHCECSSDIHVIPSGAGYPAMNSEAEKYYITNRPLLPQDLPLKKY